MIHVRAQLCANGRQESAQVWQHLRFQVHHCEKLFEISSCRVTLPCILSCKSLAKCILMEPCSIIHAHKRIHGHFQNTCVLLSAYAWAILRNFSASRAVPPPSISLCVTSVSSLSQGHGTLPSLVRLGWRDDGDMCTAKYPAASATGKERGFSRSSGLRDPPAPPRCTQAKSQPEAYGSQPPLKGGWRA